MVSGISSPSEVLQMDREKWACASRLAMYVYNVARHYMYITTFTLKWEASCRALCVEAGGGADTHKVWRCGSVWSITWTEPTDRADQNGRTLHALSVREQPLECNCSDNEFHPHMWLESKLVFPHTCEMNERKRGEEGGRGGVEEEQVCSTPYKNSLSLIVVATSLGMCTGVLLHPTCATVEPTLAWSLLKHAPRPFTN